MTSDTSHRLPVAALLALAMTGFICIVTETLPAGLLPQISQGLGISAAMAGQMVTAYACGSLLAAIPLTIATRHWRRRTVLLSTITGFLVFNSLTAIYSNYWLLLLARFLAGVAAGLAWSLLASYARRMVSPAQQGKALSIAMTGTPIALSLGVPLGTWAGGIIGWRSAFGIMSALSFILIIWVLLKVPDYPGQSKSGTLPVRKVLAIPGVGKVLATVMAWMLAHNILYTYVAPFVAQAGMQNSVGTVLLVFGFAALAGIGLTSHLIERYLRLAVLMSLTIFLAVSIGFVWLAHNPAAIYAGTVLWGLTFGGAATLLQTALADAAGDSADVALSANVVAWNSVIAGGGVAGGILLKYFAASSFPWAMIILLIAGLLIAFSAKTHGFPAGPRIKSSQGNTD